MRQVYQILAFDEHEKSDSVELGGFFPMWSKEYICFFAKNEQPVKLVQLGKQRRPTPVKQRQQAPIVNLPLELLIQIFKELDESSILPLIMTCQRFWYVGWDILGEKVKDSLCYPTWAGSRMILFGEGTEENPPGLLTAEEEHELAEIAGGYWAEELARNYPRDIEPDFEEVVNGTLFDWTYSHNFQPIDLSERPYRWLLDNKQYLLQIPPAERKIVKKFYNNKLRDLFPSIEIWVLRNITAKEYVRGDTLFSFFHKGKCPHNPYIGSPGLMEAMLSQICWSTDVSMGPPGIKDKGPWVGHRFEVCCLSAHIKDSDESWKDVSVRIATELSTICNHTFEPDDSESEAESERVKITKDIKINVE